MKQLYTTLTLLLALSVQHTFAQIVNLGWLTSILNTGHTTGSANNVGGSSINTTISINNSQSGSGSYDDFSLFTSPRVTSTYATSLGATSSNLAIGVDWGSKSRYIDIVINFSAAVKSVKFNVADIDKFTSTSTTYIDEITVTGTNGGTAVTNPTITKLTPGNDIVISNNTATANPANNRGGNSDSSPSDQDGTVTVNFGNTILTQVKIHYHNNSAADNDPGQ